MLIASAATAAFGDDHLLVGGLEVMDEFAGVLVVKGCAYRDLEGDRVAVGAGAIGAHAVFAALALVLGVVAEVNKGVVALGGDHDDVAGRTAAGNELFPAEGHAAVAAVAGFDANSCFIDEHD